MRVVVMGTGGVGGYFGGRLAQGGCDVRFVARGEHLAALREHGLRIESKLGDLQLAVRASDDAASLGPADFILISVKLWDTEAAVQAIAPLVGPETAVVSFQNGVEKEEILRRHLPQRAVLGGVSYVSAKILRPGVISQSGAMQKLVFGEFDGSASDRTAALLDACKRGGIDAEISPDITRAIWEKFIFLVGLSAVTTAMRSTIGPIRGNGRTRSFLLDVMREVVAVGRAQGVRLEEDLAEKQLAFCDGLPPGMTSSMHTDLEAGRRLELNWLSGGVTELGRLTGVPTPLNRAVCDILALHTQGRSANSQAG